MKEAPTRYLVSYFNEIGDRPDYPRFVPGSKIFRWCVDHDIAVQMLSDHHHCEKDCIVIFSISPISSDRYDFPEAS